MLRSMSDQVHPTHSIHSVCSVHPLQTEPDQILTFYRTDADQEQDMGLHESHYALSYFCSLALLIAVNQQAACKKSRGVAIGYIYGLTMNGK